MSQINTSTSIASSEFSHLDEDVKSFLFLSADKRIERIKADKWIGYQTANELTEEMETLIDSPNSIRNPGLLIIAPPNNGKSWLVRRLARKHLAREKEDGTGVCVPVVLINSPYKPDINWFLSKILTALNAPHKSSDKTHPLFDQVVGLCRRLDVRLLIADEISDVVDGTAMQQRHFLNMLKNLNNELERPIVLTGTKRIISAMAIDEQVKRRFSQRELPEWKADVELIKFLAAFERKLPLRFPSELAGKENRELVMKILDKSDNRLGYIMELLQKAAVLAVVTGREKITEELIDSVKLQN